MTVHDDLERALVMWLDDEAVSRAIDLEDVFARTRHMRQRPAWLSPGRWLPMELTQPRVHVARAIPILALIALLIVALLAAALFIGSQRRLPPPFGLAATGLFVFDAEGDIHVAAADGTGVRPLFSGPGDEYGATWSRDGSRIAYWTIDERNEAQLWVVDPDGANARRVDGRTVLTAPTWRPAVTWSPDGTRLAFGTAQGVLWVVNADGTEPRVLGSADDLRRYEPAWSPDGSLIAFRGERLEAEGPSIYVISPDGNNEVAVSRPSGGVNLMFMPEWSPDGTRLLYDAAYGAEIGDDTVGDIAVATRGAGGWTDSVIVDGEGIDFFPRWSPDGTRISYLKSRPDLEGDLYGAAADGTGPQRLSDVPLSTAVACWTPDGESIAVLTGEAGQPIDSQVGARYLVLDSHDGRQLAEIPAPGIQGILACSWQRLAP